MSITKAEKETVILFDEADACAEVYTHNTKLKNRLGARRKQTSSNVCFEVSEFRRRRFLRVPQEISDGDVSGTDQRYRQGTLQGELPQRKAVAIPTRKFNAGARIRRGQGNPSAEGKAAVKP